MGTPWQKADLLSLRTNYHFLCLSRSLSISLLFFVLDLSLSLSLDHDSRPTGNVQELKRYGWPVVCIYLCFFFLVIEIITNWNKTKKVESLQLECNVVVLKQSLGESRIKWCWLAYLQSLFPTVLHPTVVLG